jgi:hypothetical protein
MVMTCGLYWWKGGEMEAARLIAPSIIEAERRGAASGDGAVRRRSIKEDANH